MTSESKRTSEKLVDTLPKPTDNYPLYVIFAVFSAVILAGGAALVITAGGSAAMTYAGISMSGVGAIGMMITLIKSRFVYEREEAMRQSIEAKKGEENSPDEPEGKLKNNRKARSDLKIEDVTDPKYNKLKVGNLGQVTTAGNETYVDGYSVTIPANQLKPNGPYQKWLETEKDKRKAKIDSMKEGDEKTGKLQQFANRQSQLSQQIYPKKAPDEDVTIIFAKGKVVDTPFKQLLNSPLDKKIQIEPIYSKDKYDYQKHAGKQEVNIIYANGSYFGGDWNLYAAQEESLFTDNEQLMYLNYASSLFDLPTPMHMAAQNKSTKEPEPYFVYEDKAHFAGIAALNWFKGVNDYELENLEYHLKAAYAAFAGFKISMQKRYPNDSIVVHSGPWGCVSFKNNAKVMFTLQILAARMAGVEIVFHIGDTDPNYLNECYALANFATTPMAALNEIYKLQTDKNNAEYWSPKAEYRKNNPFIKQKKQESKIEEI